MPARRHALALPFAVALLCAACGDEQRVPDAKPAAPPAPPVMNASQPPSARPLRDRLLTAFGGYEFVPGREALLKIAPEPELVPGLIALWQDPAAPLNARINALASLRHWPSLLTRAVFEAALQAAVTPDAARRSAVKAYGVAFGPDAVPLLALLSTHRDLHTRDAVARALARVGTAGSKAALGKALEAETEPSVRTTLEAAIAGRLSR